MLYEKLQLHLFIGFRGQHLPHCFARVGGFKPSYNSFSQTKPFLYNTLMLTMQNAQCLYPCLIVTNQHKHVTSCHIVPHKYLYYTQGFSIHILFISTDNKLWLTIPYLDRFNHLSSCLAPHISNLHGSCPHLRAAVNGVRLFTVAHRWYVWTAYQLI